MAHLIPDVDQKTIENRPERDVARYLVDLLPEDCLVFHSYPWLRPERNDRNVEYLGEGETDFVILDPNRGVLTLEVNGGEIVYEPRKREWFRVLPVLGRRLKAHRDGPGCPGLHLEGPEAFPATYV